LIIWASAMPTEAHGLECPYPNTHKPFLENCSN